MITDQYYKETKVYSKKKIIEFYNSYIKNLEYTPFKTTFIHPKDMHLRQLKYRSWETDSKKDAYIKESIHNHLSLGQDILKNGTYWPIWLYEENNKTIVSEGIHRVDSIKQLIALNEWGSKKMFSIIIPKGLDVSEGNEEPFLFSINPIYVYLPVFNIEDRDLYYFKFERYLTAYKENMDRFNTIKEDGCLKIKINNFLDYIYLFKIYHKFLRHVFYKYKINNNDFIMPYDYSQFKKREDAICIDKK